MLFHLQRMAVDLTYKAIKLRNAYRDQLEAIHMAVDEEDFYGWSDSVLKMRLKLLDDIWDRLYSQHMIVTGNIDDADAEKDMLMEYFSEIQSTYIETRAKIDHRLSEGEALRRRGESTSATNSAMTSFTTYASAAAIQVAQFKGEHTKWAAWRDTFIAKVYGTEMPEVLKLEHLTKAVTGRAAEVMGDWALEVGNLEPAWAKLKRVYDDDYQLVRAHIDRILEIESLDHESESGLRKLIDIPDQELRCLEKFGVHVKGWDPIICCILIKKLDPDTIAAWEMTREIGKIPELKQLVGFLERRIQAIRNRNIVVEASNSRSSGSSGSKAQDAKHSRDSSRHRPYQNRSWTSGKSHGDHTSIIKQETGAKSNGSQPNYPSECPACTQQHRLWHCHVFKAMTLEERCEKLRKWKLCECCLQLGHSANDCGSQGCPKCDRAKHNSLICPNARPNLLQLQSKVVVCDKPRRKRNHSRSGGNRKRNE